MGSILELQELILKKDDRIRHLEAKLKNREDEIVELRSQLDKFQSVMTYAGAGVTKGRARKERAQGISAEPQSLKTMQELASLSQTTFPVVFKSLRLVQRSRDKSKSFSYALLVCPTCRVGRWQQQQQQQIASPACTTG
ncbi:uncharacterized protein LOC143040175 [Oratosquilla oratoria]|uniref:uncharacterized protein LOC143040175 n=1 Tax=Oratosquilla oratoria TaxID=337810 RepID=UPI003F759375